MDPLDNPLPTDIPTYQKQPPMPLPLLALLPTIGSALTGAANFFGQQASSKAASQTAQLNTDKTIQANKDAANLAYQRDMAQWDRSNTYNAPSASMARLKDAGLNPMLAYGTPNQATPSPAMGTPTAQYGYQAQQVPQVPNVDLNVTGQMQQLQGLQYQKAQIENIETNTRATEAKTANEIIQGTLLAIESLYKERGLAADTKSKEISAGFLSQEKLVAILQQQAATAATNLSMEQSKGLFPYDLAFKKGSIPQQKASTEETLARIKNLGYQGIQTQEQTKAITEDITLKQLQHKLGSQDLVQKEWENFLRSKNMDPKDNPITLGTRYFGQFFRWLQER